MRPTRVMLVMVVLLAMAACTRSSEPTDTTVARMRCQPPGTVQYIACEITLLEDAGLEIVLDDTECNAHGNILRMTKPIQQVLTNDGCYVPQGTVWEIPGIFGAGTTVAMEIEGPRLMNSAELRVQGVWPEWTLFYEDGADQDFDDMILIVRALPTN